MKMPSKIYMIPVLAVSLIISLFLLAQKIIFPAMAFSGSGLGTESSPFQITSCAQFLEIQNSLSSWYIVMDNMDCEGVTWTPIGTFTGHLDGNNKTVSNISITKDAAETGSNLGIFGAIEGGSVTDLNIVNVNIYAPKYEYVGGLAGEAGYGSGNSTFSNITVSGSVNGYRNVGGLVGYVDGTAVTNCHSSVNVSGGGTLGGLIGYASTDITDSSSSGTIAGGLSGVPFFDENIGGLVGVAIKNITNSYSSSPITSGGNITGGLVGYASGTGYSVSGCYANGDITVTGEKIGGLVGWNYAAIINSYATGDLNITGSIAGGLVGVINGDITTSYAEGSVTASAGYVGGLVGDAYANIYQSYAIGNVSGTDYIGGLVGNTSGVINNSFATGNVNASTGDAGGLIGDTTGTVTNSYSVGTVTSTESYVGGMIGWSNQAVTSSYYNSETTSQTDTDRGTPKTTTQLKTQGTFTDWDFTNIWRFVSGVNNGYPINYEVALVLSDVATVSSSTFTVSDGGTSNETITNVPYQTPFDTFLAALTKDNEAQTWNTDYISDPVMTDDILTVTAEDGTTIVTYTITVNGGPDFSGSGVGTTLNPYQITTCNQLHEMNNHLDAEYILMNNIDCNDYPWTAVGLNPGVPFTGVLNGNSKTISNLEIMNNEVGGAFHGLFGAIIGANIHDLNIFNATVDAKNAQNVGILAGAIWFGSTIPEITNIHVSGTVYGESLVGGLIGAIFKAGSLISNCSADVDVYQEGLSASGTGGLIGFSAANIDGCYATGDVHSTMSSAGGLVGDASFMGSPDPTVEIKNSYATGTIWGSDYVGGLVGRSLIPVSNSHATGDISGTYMGGGLLGYTNKNVSNSYSFGNVTVTNNIAGGLIGQIEGGITSNVYALGNVSGTSQVGGLVGSLAGTIENGYSRGSVTATSSIGGLVGIVNSGSITSSYYNSQTSGQSDTGKGAPITSSQMATQSTYTDWDFDDIWVLGLPVDLSSNPAAAGSIDVSGSFVNIPTFRNQVKQATVTETPSTWYVFNNWTEDGVIASTNSSYQFFYTGSESPAKKITANFLYSYIAPIINDVDEDDDPVPQEEEVEDVIPEEEITVPNEESGDDVVHENAPDKDAEKPEKDNIIVKTVQVLAASVGEVARRVKETVQTLPITEDTSESISATALAVVAVAPAITVGLGSSYSIASFLNVPTFLFAFLGVGKKKRNCGLVYNSLTKEPIRNAIVRIYGVDDRLVSTEVTNELGFFESDLQTGDYSIVVNVNGYKFPTKIIIGIKDLPYENIYKGGEFHYDSASDISYSIPVDPLDKNIVEDAKVISRNMIIKIVDSLTNTVVFVGLIFSIISYMKLNNALNLILLILYLLIVMGGIILRRQGKYGYGIVKDLNGNPLSGVELGLVETEFNTVYAKRVTDIKGKYRFIVPGGSYKLVSLDSRYKLPQDKSYLLDCRSKKIVSISEDITI